MLEVGLPMKRAWSFSGCLQRIGILAHIPNCFLGLYYPTYISVELSSPKLCAYKSKPGPRLHISDVQINKVDIKISKHCLYCFVHSMFCLPFLVYYKYTYVSNGTP